VLKEETPTPTPETPKTEEKPAAVGTKLDVTEGTFKVTNQTGSNAEVEFSAPKSTTTKKVVIPDTIEKNGVTYKVTSVAASAFKNNKTITSVTLGSNIETIEKNAFNGCTKLKTVKLNNTVVTIGDSAFSGCTSLTKITIPANVTTIGKNVFKGDKKLKTITIKSTKIKKVGAKAFKGIKSNATIKVPSKKLKAYTKLFKGKGQAATVKIKK
jgi:hypothetical protein